MITHFKNHTTSNLIVFLHPHSPTFSHLHSSIFLVLQSHSFKPSHSNILPLPHAYSILPHSPIPPPTCPFSTPTRLFHTPTLTHPSSYMHLPPLPHPHTDHSSRGSVPTARGSPGLPVLCFARIAFVPCANPVTVQSFFN